MQYAQVGDTGLVVSRMGFGAMTFGEGEMVSGVQNRIGQALADRMVAMCLDRGITLFDTADAYRAGETEEILGRALGARRQEVVISTKVGFRTGEALLDAGLSCRHILHSAEGSLRRLGTDWIDLYQLHIPDAFTPLEETARALEHLVRSGKVRYVGVSNFPAWRAARLLGAEERVGWTPIKVAQMYYSLLGRDLEHEWVPFAASAGIGILGWSPLASGFLSGKYTRERPVPQDSRRATFQFPPIDVERGYDVVAVLGEIAAARNATSAQVALAWTLSRSFLTSVLVGASKVEQLVDNLKAADLVLTPEEVARLDELTRPQPIYPNYMVTAMGADARLKAALARQGGG